MATLTNEIVARLQERVTRSAETVAARSGWAIEADEAEQRIWLAICERAAEDETFLDQQDAYIVAAGEYAARTSLWKRVYRHSLSGAQEIAIDDETWEWIRAGDAGPMVGQAQEGEESTSILGAMEAIFDGHPPVWRFIAESLIAGLQKKEIAARLEAAGFPARSGAWVGQVAKRRIAPLVQHCWMEA